MGPAGRNVTQNYTRVKKNTDVHTSQHIPSQYNSHSHPKWVNPPSTLQRGVEGEGATPGKAASLGMYLAASAESGTAVRRRGRKGGEGRREDRWGGARPRADRAGSQ